VSVLVNLIKLANLSKRAPAGGGPGPTRGRAKVHGGIGGSRAVRSSHPISGGGEERGRPVRTVAQSG
jgi:hypothetical protein